MRISDWSSDVCSSDLARQIVRQRIDPDVHDMAWAAGNGDAPVKARARDRQVRQASSDEAHHFIATAVGLDELRVRLIMRQKPVGIGGKAEEPTYLHGPFHRRALGGELWAPLPLCP